MIQNSIKYKLIGSFDIQTQYVKDALHSVCIIYIKMCICMYKHIYIYVNYIHKHTEKEVNFKAFFMG